MSAPEPFGLPGSRAQLARAVEAMARADGDRWCEACWDYQPHTRCHCAPAPEDEPRADCGHCDGSGRCPVAGGGWP